MSYDLAIIGSGPGGYVCAIRAAQLRLKVRVLTSKALLHTSELFEAAGHDFAGFGIGVGQPVLDLKAMMAHKDAVFDANVSGVAFLFKKNKIESVRGIGSLAGPGKVRVAKEDGSQE